jgi:hypothetical protein
MAEFKLGRIRFVWKDAWSSTTVYYKDDVVRNGGNTYVCTSGHTSSTDFANDENNFWNLLSEGQAWKGDWAINTYYSVNDVVKYGGQLYIANTSHTSAATEDEGLEGLGTTTPGVRDDIGKWDLYGEGFDYKAEWNFSSRYKINDIVKYNSTLYICTEDHISAVSNALGLEADQSKWDVFTKGLEWQDAWQTTVRYRVNDIVRYGGQIYVCNEGHTSASTLGDGLEADQSKWDYFHKGIEYKGDWASATRYKINDLVKWGGGIWICTTYHTSTDTLTSDEANWAQFVEGLEFEDNWSPTVNYQAGDLVTYGGYIYAAITNNIGVKPVDSDTDWDLFTTGFNFTGNYGEDSTNQQYRVGDVTTLGGYTYLCIQDHDTAQRPPNTLYWERLNSGLYWKDAWADATYYDLGDVVRYGDSSYVCVLSHTSDETVAQNRPDQDVDGSEWNLVASGPETSVLTTQGDMVYYGGAGPTRLPIGTAGQVLAVNAAGDSPAWKYAGAINNVFYVAPSGVDSPAPIYGTTLDQPFKTVRYAAEQVEQGALRYNAKNLLERNRAFIQDELQAYMTTTYSLADPSTFEVDAGIIVDALIWDLSHGGNVRSREAALTYFNVDGDTYTYATATQAQAADGINLIKNIADAVLSNVAPATTYGTITQVIDSTFTEEADAQAQLETLVNVITDAITAGNTDDIPAEKKTQNTIFVKTGEFSEVLPIIVPENTAVVGDELRSTRIKAGGSFVNSSDVPFSLDAISRLQAIISDVVQNTPITKSTSNAASQVTTRPAGAAAAGTAAAGIVQDIYDKIDFDINAAGTEPTLAGTNTPVTSTDYTYAVEVLEANRTFLVAEITAYIADNQPGNTNYDVAACERDVNRYLDAVKYDLIYTGNYKALLAARYYVNAVNGSTLEDMFYMRNGTGLRNCTVVGLNGTLGAANSFGTKRPTAGAYVSLDPGWGPAHTDAWIINKSPYVQNVTTFGNGCIGCKIDGDLHDGGNDSIVANDFTQIVSDGIGVWCTNLGRTELVSVFSYYAHIGYLAENGGKIRATNGNSSYGDFGTVAEGVDSTETAITGQIDNRAFDAVVNRVLTDGNEILILEYLNAGQDYTVGGTTLTVTGEGFGASINSPVVKNGGVFEVRMLDTNDEFGGADYLTTQNVAQEGNTTTLTLSNTDVGLSSQYAGMAIYIIAGRGAGQYGYISSYNDGTKIAQISKQSNGAAGWDHVTGAAIETTLDATTTYVIEPRISFSAPASGLYTDTAKGRAVIEDGQIQRILLWDPGTGYTVAPTLTITDPNNTVDAPTQIRIADGVLAQPTWTSRGTGFSTAAVEVSGDGFMDRFQPGAQIRVKNLSDVPEPGANITFGTLSGEFFKLVAVRDLQGTGPYTAQLQVAPDLTVTQAPPHDDTIEMRIRYSQVRLTGHDFLDIGTGNFTNTNYPNDPINPPDATKETSNFGGGRVFYTSTDQDGNFRVGELFSVEQSTGIATLNADAFNLSGLQELSLGELGLGGTGATISEFSTDGTFTADSDNIVPTQKAIKTYITSQIGGGAATLNVNSITAGQVQISGQEITTTTGNQILVTNKMNFQSGVDGVPVAMNYFLTQ